MIRIAMEWLTKSKIDFPSSPQTSLEPTKKL